MFRWFQAASGRYIVRHHSTLQLRNTAVMRRERTVINLSCSLCHLNPMITIPSERRHCGLYMLLNITCHLDLRIVSWHSKSDVSKIITMLVIKMRVIKWGKGSLFVYVFKKYRFLLKNTGLWASKYRFVFPEVCLTQAIKIQNFIPQDTLSYIPECAKTQELPGTPPHGPQPGASGGPQPLCTLLTTLHLRCP